MFSGIIMAIQSLTRIYLLDLPFDEKKFGRSSAYFPIVGIIIGLFYFAIYAVAGKHFPPLVVASLILVGKLLITGGMHLDGFMDTMDGLFSGRKKERMLEIMKDSRVGANGVMAAIVLFLLKFSLLFTLVQFDAPFVLASLILMATLSRWAQVYAIKSFPYLTEKGLGTLYKDNTGKKELAIATSITLIITLFFFKLAGLTMFIITFLFTLLVAKQITKVIGGLTGDIYGAINELLEVLVLLVIILL